VFKFSVPKPVVLFLVLLTWSIVLFFFIYFIIAEEKRFRKLDKKHQEIESIRNIIRILIFEAVIPLYILFISLIYGKGPKIWALIVLLTIAIISIFTAIGLWKFRKKQQIRLVAKVLSILFLLPVTILFQVTLPWILLAGYYLSISFVIFCIIFVLSALIISWIKEIREKRSNR
jgi:hypothetical protein